MRILYKVICLFVIILYSGHDKTFTRLKVTNSTVVVQNHHVLHQAHDSSLID
jgi:hypothetical protein